MGRPTGSRDLSGRAAQCRMMRGRGSDIPDPVWRSSCVEFGRKLRDIRIAAGIAASEVASAIGVSVHTVFAWERGRSFPSMQALHALSVAIGCLVVDLLPDSMVQR